MPDAHVREKPRSVDNQRANNTKSTMQHTRQRDNGGFFRCRHLYPIFLDQSEDRFHLAYECCQEKCEQPSMVRKLLPCGVCKPIATVGVRPNLFFTKYGDKYHMGQCKHIQQSDHARVRGVPMCVECERSCMADRWLETCCCSCFFVTCGFSDFDCYGWLVLPDACRIFYEQDRVELYRM